MSGKEKEGEWKEEMILDHWSHKHPLTWVQTHRKDDCWGCGRYFHSGEQGYGCGKKCAYGKLLHEECAEMPRKIRHPKHPQHILEIAQENPYRLSCAISKRDIKRLGYYCTSSECEFGIDIKCAQADREVMDADLDHDEEQSRDMQHPSHPQHPLVRVSRRCTLRCCACGTSEKGIFYACFVCEYWIHQKCALLPESIVRESYHPHLLSLSFRIPPQYIKYGFHFECGVCNQDLVCKYWIYHCQDCRFIIHIKCAQRIAGNYLIFPINDVIEEQIKPFARMINGGKSYINDELSVNVKYEFHSHKHKLSFISSSSSSNSNSSEYIICSGCITPIVVENSYLSCSECKYHLHRECFHLPPELPSIPLHREGDDHNLILESCSDKLDFWRRCSVCCHYMNGLVYSCTNCSFEADIKCASLLDRVYHAAHQQHHLNYLSKEDMQSISYSRRLCDAGCGLTASKFDCYVCGSCDDFVVHVRCAVLPASVKNRRWDEHPLQLSSYSHEYNTSHPLHFFCDHCEEEMNPEKWMYDCDHCNCSFHPDCLAVVSGKYRNIKFGEEYIFDNVHPHPLTYHLLTTKRRCDGCGREAYGERGFQCESCFFFICLDLCAFTMMVYLGLIQISD